MSRLDPPDFANLTPEQQVIYDAIAGGPRGGVGGPLALWLHRPGLAGPAQALGAYSRYGTKLPPRLSELAIIVTAAFWKSGYEWAVHAPQALKQGISQEIVDAIDAGQVPEFVNEDEAVVYEVSQTLHSEHKLSEGLYARAIGVLGAEAMVDLVGILGYYTLISMTINVFEVDPNSPRI